MTVVWYRSSVTVVVGVVMVKSGFESCVCLLLLREDGRLLIFL